MFFLHLKNKDKGRVEDYTDLLNIGNGKLNGIFTQSYKRKPPVAKYIKKSQQCSVSARPCLINELKSLKEIDKECMGNW